MVTVRDGQSRSPRFLLCVTVTWAIHTSPILLADDAILRQHIYREYPRLDPKHSDYEKLADWDIVCLLRDFSYRHTCYSNSVESQSYRAGAAIVDRMLAGDVPLSDVYKFFDNDEGGVVCGHAAHLLRELFAEFGYDAWYVGHGFSPPTASGSRFTHAETLVRITVTDENGSSKKLLTLHDPSLNLSYAAPGGKRPIDYFEMLTRLTNRQADNIAFRSAFDGLKTAPHPATICFADETAGRDPSDFEASWNIGDDYQWVDLGERKWKFIGPRQRHAFERLGDSWWKKELLREGMPGKTIYLHCFPFQVSGGPGAEKLLRKAQRIVR